MSDLTVEERASRHERLRHAVNLIKNGQPKPARAILRELIHEDGNFEEAWLWMSVSVDSLEDSYICLDNVLRINPRNRSAASAYYRIRQREMRMEQIRDRIQMYRGLILTIYWLFVFIMLFGMLFSLG